MIYDLHVHTTASDGRCSPEEVIDEAIRQKLLGIAITDHDTVDGIWTAMHYVKEKQERVNVIPGIEMNTEMDEDEIHILGYYIDYSNEKLISRLLEIREHRYDRAVKMVDKLKNSGFDISFEQVEKLAMGNLIARPHIAQALIQNGYVQSIREAFEDLIGKGRVAYVPRYKFKPEEAISLIKHSGGISFLAHPGLIKDQKKIDTVISMGIEGIEVYYPQHGQDYRKELLKLANKHNLLVSGGSDFHGPETGENRTKLGLAGINEKIMQKINDYYKKKTGYTVPQ